jgi:SAM-dependent methyltransferase
MGHRVTVVDPRGYGFWHPNLEIIEGLAEDLPAEATAFDAVLVISSIEHFGTGAYGQGTAERADLRAAHDLRGRLRPGGTMVLTVPLGPPSVDDFQRVYDPDGVRELLEGLDIRVFSAAWRADLVTWIAGDPEERRGEVGVALVAAMRPTE